MAGRSKTLSSRYRSVAVFLLFSSFLSVCPSVSWTVKTRVISKYQRLFPDLAKKESDIYLAVHAFLVCRALHVSPSCPTYTTTPRLAHR